MDYAGQNQIITPSKRKIFTPAVSVLLGLAILGFILSFFIGELAFSLFGLSYQGILAGKIWQLITYPFVDGNPINLVFNGLMLLFLGSMIESEWKSKSFIALWLVISVCCGLIWLLVSFLSGTNFIGTGTLACNYGLVTTTAILFRHQKFFIFFASFDSKIIVLIFIVIGILINLSMPINLIWLTGAPVAYAYIKLIWSIKSRKTISHTRFKTLRSNGFVDID